MLKINRWIISIFYFSPLLAMLKKYQALDSFCHTSCHFRYSSIFIFYHSTKETTNQQKQPTTQQQTNISSKQYNQAKSFSFLFQVVKKYSHGCSDSFSPGVIVTYYGFVKFFEKFLWNVQSKPSFFSHFYPMALTTGHYISFTIQ